MWRELPPTAGLPLAWSDLAPQPIKTTLEEKLSDILQAGVTPLLSSGTASLVVALHYLRCKSERRQVVIPGYTCPLVPIAIAQAGLKPVVCDTQTDSFDFHLDSLAACLKSDVLAVMPTHIGGLPANMQPVLKMARAAGAFVIEDAAQALGAKIAGRAAGTISDIGVFSLSMGKGLSIYQAGFLAGTNPQTIADLSAAGCRLAQRNWRREALRILQLGGYAAFYNPTCLYFAYGLPLRRLLERGDLEAAAGDRFSLSEEIAPVGALRRQVGARAAQRLMPFVESNRRRARQRIAWLSEIPGIRVLDEGPDCQGSFPFLTVVFDDQAACRSALATLWTAGLGVGQLFTRAITDYSYLYTILQGCPQACNAAGMAARCLTITNSPWLSDADFHSVRVSIAQAAAQMRRLRSHALR